MALWSVRGIGARDLSSREIITAVRKACAAARVCSVRVSVISMVSAVRGSESLRWLNDEAALAIAAALEDCGIDVELENV